MVTEGDLTETIFQERLEELFRQAKDWIPNYVELARLSDEASERAKQKIAEYAMSVRTSKIDESELEAFFKKPYFLRKLEGKHDESYELIIPKWSDIQVGWLDRSTESYNVFLVNRYVDLLDELPAALKRELNWKEAPKLELEGEYIKGNDGALREAWANPAYRPYLQSQDKQGIRINPKRIFDVVAQLYKDGVLVSKRKPLPKENLRTPTAGLNFELRDYQEEAWRDFEQYSHQGLFYPPSTGKTFVGMYTMAALKPMALVACPSTLLVEQWKANIEMHTEIPKDDYIVCTYHTAIKRYLKDKFNLLIIDETHHLPANMFAQLSMILRNHTLGLTASPHREDGRQNYIFALTGKPKGLRWEYFKKAKIIQNPVCHVWLLKSEAMRMVKLEALLKYPGKTIIFCDGIELGRQVAKRFDIPHIHGATKEGKLKLIEAAEVFVLSRVGDEGLSLPELQRVIEIDYLYGSRRQELQRFTRLLHGKGTTGEHHILMTVPQFTRDRKRLYSIIDHGFKVDIHKEGISDKLISKDSDSREPRHRSRGGTLAQESADIPSADESIDKLKKYVEALPNKTYLNLTSVKRRLDKLPIAQAKLYAFLLSNDGTWYKRTKLSILLDYSSLNSFKVAVKPNQLVEDGLIEQQKVPADKEKKTGPELAYRTSMAEKMA